MTDRITSTAPQATPPAAPLEWTVTGMDCAACVLKVKTAVATLPGVSAVELGLMNERLRLHLDPAATTDPATIEGAVRALGYGIGPRGSAADAGAGRMHRPPHEHCHDHDHDHSHPAAPAGEGAPAWYRGTKGRLVLLSGGLLALAWASGALLAPTHGQWIFGVACLIGLVPIAQRALAALRFGQPFTIESLMTIAALGALVIGAAEEAALVVFLFAVGEVLEGVAANRARDGIRALGQLVPDGAWLLPPDGPREVPAASLQPGQIVLVRPGERIPADGEITAGHGSIDESPVTGESMPQTRGPGAAVFAGTIATDAALEVRVTRPAADNTIARIIRLVEEAESARAPTERFIDRFSRWYMPAVVGLAVLVVLVPPLLAGGDWGVWLYRGLTLLLIGCPCALVISVPAAIAAALATGTRHGLLLKGGAVVEATAGIRHVAFDKTGTLTHGRPVVTDVITLGDTTAPRLLALAAAVEGGSAHPLARAITDHAAAQGIIPPPARDARALPGQGVVAAIAGAEVWITAPQHAGAGAFTPAMLAPATGLEAAGKTVVAVWHPGRPLGLIALRDEPRADAAAAMAELQAMGIATTMLTGDNPRTAAAIATALGMDHRAGLMPQDKLAAIDQLAAGGPVMMVGDGINDAPALKQATVGVAMGSGTDVALETADAALLRNRVRDVPALIRLARAAMANIHQNITIALGLKGVFLVTSVLGITGLWLAVLADTGATVLVTLNALRLLRHDPGATPGRPHTSAQPGTHNRESSTKNG